MRLRRAASSGPTGSGLFGAWVASRSVSPCVISAGHSIKGLSVKDGTSQIWQGTPALSVVLVGGFTTNFIWCLILNVRNRTGYQYFSSRIHEGGPDRTDEPILESVTDAPGEEMAVAAAISADKTKLTRDRKSTRLNSSHGYISYAVFC